MIKGIFSDLDGTLVNTHHANFEAYKKAIYEVSGREISLNDFKKTIGYGAQTFLPKLAPGLSPEEYEHISDKKGDYYRSLMHLTSLNDALVLFMRSLSNVQLVLVTSARRKNAEIVLRHHDIYDDFTYIVTGDDVVEPKPSAEAYQLALKNTKLAESEVIAFEDSESGKVAAESAGISVIQIDKFAL